MSAGQKIGIALLVSAFIAAKVFVLVSRRTGFAIATLGAVLLVFSESANAD